MLFPEFTAGEILIRFCRSTPVGTSALQARIAAESRSCSKYFCNDRVNLLRRVFRAENRSAIVISVSAL
jgi:hypothetical protein